MQPRQAVLVDTNIMIEAVRTGCWNAIKSHFDVHTVEKCVEEARTGDRYRPGYVAVPEPALRDKLSAHAVSQAETAVLAVSDAEAYRLDPGERELLAHALGRQDDWRLVCSDRAGINAAMRLGWGDRAVSLEELAQAAGARHAVKTLKSHFTANHLKSWKVAALLLQGAGKQ